MIGARAARPRAATLVAALVAALGAWLVAVLVALASSEPAHAQAAAHRPTFALMPGAPAQGRLSCKHGPTYADAVADCEARYGTTTWCGGLDRDRDSLPCECNAGGPDGHDHACVKWRSANQ